MDLIETSTQARMISLANRSATDHLRVLDLPYRLCSWALDDPENIHFWYDADQNMAAWAVLQTPFWTVDITCRPDLDVILYPEILAWADQRACQAAGTTYGHPAWFITVFADQVQRISALEQAGFKDQSDLGEDSWSKVFMRRSQPGPVKVYTPPAGYCVRPLAGAADVQAYVDLHREVFDTKNMTLEWRQRTLEHPAYRADLDLVVAAPDGRLVAFCVCWYDEPTRSGQVEPLGCHQDFRRYALGRVALSAGLQRLQELGAQHIFVETDNYRNTAYRLYESFGFGNARQVLVFGKEYG